MGINSYCEKFTRDPAIYGRALRLGEKLRILHGRGKIDRRELSRRQNRISRAHYREQRRAGSPYYTDPTI